MNIEKLAFDYIVNIKCQAREVNIDNRLKAA